MPEKSLQSLIDDFHRNIDIYKTNAYNEANTRIQFIDRFFELLGWDVNNKQGFSEAYKEVVHEDSLKIGSYMKAPDYSFRLGGSRIFFVEAKKPSVDIKNDIVPAYQLRRYGWTAKLSVSILTDFEEFAVYDCRVKPDKTDKASTARILYFTYKEFIEKWDEIYALFAKENILKGSLENFVKSAKKVKGTSEVDKEFLKEISSWRDVLARNIALRNSNLSSQELNFCVQRTIDRIIFLRMCEDRGIEDYGRLKALTNGGRIYPRLFQLFQAADDRYNSGLFYFRKEKGREEQPDEVSPLIEIDDKIIKNILTGLYYPDCPYEFSVLPADILGNVYEQFLGKVIRLTPSHQAKIEEKPEVKKAGGVYYTPKYIVDYIVENTIGETLGNSPFPKGGEGDLKNNSKLKIQNSKFLKILDPACGSGSFLLGAYQYLLDWYLKYYSENDPKNWLKKKNPPIYVSRTSKCEQSPPFKGDLGGCNSGGFKLTTSEKKRILLDHIYGVDIDSQAVEVTKLSLLLKVLEDVNQDALESQLKLFHERALPDLSRNIKCGNSLIGQDFYENRQLDLLDEEEQLKINVFDWQSSFPDVFNQQNPGFDVVIGNPPYGAKLVGESRTYLADKFDVGNTDTAALFMIKGTKLANENGCVSYIIPKGFTYASNWKKTRENLIENLELIVDCSKVWQQVKYEMAVFKWQNNFKSKNYKSYIRQEEEIIYAGVISKKLYQEFDFIVNGITKSEIKVGQKIKVTNFVLNDLVKNQRGAMYQKFVSETGDKNVIGGKQINRYKTVHDIKGKIESKKIQDNKALIKTNSILAQNIIAHVVKPSPHIIIIANISEEFDRENTIILDTINQLQNISEFSNKYILGILNSKLVGWYTYRFIFGHAIRTMHFDSTTTSKIPYPNLDLSNSTDKKRHDQMTKYVDRMLELHKRIEKVKTPYEKTNIQNQISATDKAIDKLVYELYELTEDEIKIVEEATK